MQRKETRSFDEEKKRIARIKAILEYTASSFPPSLVASAENTITILPRISNNRQEQIIALYDELLRRITLLERQSDGKRREEEVKEIQSKLLISRYQVIQ